MSTAPRQFRYISSDRRVLEDRRFVVGKGNFVADIVRPNMKHVALVFSPHPAAQILSIDGSEAMACRRRK
jgi:2-furoyl-CoA dehydrogenase large subunit